MKGEQTMPLKIDYREVMSRIKDDVNYVADEAYNKGYKIGRLSCSSKIDEAYQKGLADAWEAARKIVLSPDEGGTSLPDLFAIFGNGSMQSVFRNYSASQAITKLKDHEEKRKVNDEIKVGDEVKRKTASENDNRGIVTKEWKDVYYIMLPDGSSGMWDKDRIVKTGRHFDVDKILEEIRK